MQDQQTWLYPEIEPYRIGRLSVSNAHNLYFEECGNPEGKPVVFVHGGPGGGAGPQDRRFFDPAKYRIVLFDQRGAGKSEPAASLEENTTWHLIEDLEKLRNHLKINRWQVFGGSWGSTLALAYAVSYPAVVTELVLRGIFLIRKKEIDWYYQEGASAIYPDAWEAYRDHIPPAERGNFVEAYYKRLTSNDPEVRLAAAVPWTTWEMATSRIYTSPEALAALVTDDFALRFARIECHYFINEGFFEEDGWLLGQIDRIRHIPTVIVQGRYDVVCPARSAWDLHRAWPEAKLFITPDAGHASREPGNARALVSATDRFSGEI
ncbi:MAG: prolyl aminopeptidase [Bdellovibrionales bacterium]|nr:prolyl aminopeptidase [Oligoflexia bacterium]